MAPPNAGGERPLAFALAPAACGPAAEDEGRAANSSAPDESGAIVVYVAPPAPLAACPSESFKAAEDAGVPTPSFGAEPIDAIPLAVRPPAAGFAANADAPVSFAAPRVQARPKRKAPTKAAAAASERPKPEWLRSFLQKLNLRMDLPVHFIDQKVLTHTDMDAHQNRLRLRTDGALNHLRPILIPEERRAANILDLNTPKDRSPKRQKTDGAAAAGDDAEQGKKKRKKGKVHGGLPVVVVDMNGVRKQLQLSRWESSRGIIIKGEGYLDFIKQCAFKKDDVIEIWAFKQRQFRLFGNNLLDESPLYLLMVKTSESVGEQPGGGIASTVTAL